MSDMTVTQLQRKLGFTDTDLAALRTIPDLSSTEFGVIDGVTAGTVTAEKAVVVDSNKDIGDFRNLDAVNIDAGASGTAGTVDVFPATAANGKLILAAVDAGGAFNTTISNKTIGQSTVVSIPDPGASTADFVLNAGTATIAGAKTFSSAVTINPTTNQLVLGVTNTTTISATAPAASRVVTLADPGANANLITSTGIGGTQIARCSAQFDATSGDTGTTLTNLTGMVLTVIPATYKYRVCLPGVATANSGIKAAFKLTTTVLTSIEATGLAYTASGVAVQHTTTTTDQTSQIASTTAAIYTVLEGSMVVGTGGTIQIQAAQNASHADTTSVYAGATFELTRIA